MIEFKYDKKIDRECWERVISAGEMFGHKFPTSFNITPEMVKEAEIAVTEFKKRWKESGVDFQNGIKKIFNQEPPDLICYINTSPYSMDSYPKYISISMHRKSVGTIIHEFSHYMFRYCFPDTKDIENIKEIVTIINNDVFKVKDCGWRIHEEQREEALRIWRKTQDIKKVIAGINKGKKQK